MAERLPPLMPTIKFFGLDAEHYDKLYWEEISRGNSTWKWNDSRTITYFPKTRPEGKTTIQIQFHPEDIEIYNNFEGIEDATGDIIWKDAELGNVEVTMFKPEVKDANTSTG